MPASWTPAPERASWESAWPPLGTATLVAMDLSAGMLEQARQKGVYRECRQMVLGEVLDFPTGSFGAVISVGVFTLGHAPAESLHELVRITKPGGHVLFGLRPDVYEANGFKEVQAELESRGAWKLVEEGREFQPLPKGEPEVYPPGLGIPRPVAITAVAVVASYRRGALVQGPLLLGRRWSHGGLAAIMECVMSGVRRLCRPGRSGPAVVDG